MLTAGELIDEARDWHPSFDTKALPNKPALRQLTRLERRLVTRITQINESALAERIPIRSMEMALMRGLRLPEHILLLDVAYERDGRHWPISLVNHAERITTGLQRFPSGYLSGGRFFPTNLMDFGRTETGWELFDTVYVLLVKVPPQFTSLDEQIHVPEVAHEALVAGLAHWMAMRKGLPESTFFFQQAQEAEERAVMTVADRGSTTPWLVRVTHHV